MLIGHPIFWILAVAVLAPLLAEIPTPFKVPVVVLEVLLGIVIGPHVLELVTLMGSWKRCLPLARPRLCSLEGWSLILLILKADQ